MPTIDCPGSIAFCPPIIGGGGIGFEGATVAPRFEELVPAATQVEMARFPLDITPNQSYLFNGIVAGMQDQVGGGSAEASLFMIVATRDNAGALAIGLGAGLGDAASLNLNVFFDGDDFVL